MPLLIGETGGTTEGRDRAWAEAALTYFEAHGFGLFWYCLNPNSDDTGVPLRRRVRRAPARHPRAFCSGMASRVCFR